MRAIQASSIITGANPIEVYSSVTSTTSGSGQTCLVPGAKTFAGSSQVTLASYSSQTIGSYTTLTLQIPVPASGFVFLAIHLDYGLKATTGFTKSATGNNAVACTNTASVLIPDGQTYSFSVGGPVSGAGTVTSCNVFKKNPGVAGLAKSATTTYEVPNANAALKDAKGTVLISGLTDQDGWYMLPYKWTGKATTLYVTLTPPGGKAQTQKITLKANGYVEADFTTP